MAIKFYKPTTPGRRQMTVTDYSELSKVAPEKSLLSVIKATAGRNNTGRITVRHQGGGNRRKYRVIDFKREKLDMPATVLTLEYDPNRSAHIALVQYEDGEKRYILAPVGLKVGDTVVSGPNADIKPGNALPLANIPVGTVIHNVELYPGKGAQQARAAGNMAQLMAKEGKYGMIRLPSGELRNVQLNCMATIGQVGNIDHENDEPAVIDVAQDSVVTDPVSPHACQVSRQCLAPASWVFELRYLVKLVKHPRGNALIELAHRLVGVPREINSPGHSAPLPRRCCRSQACQHDSPRYP